jgi:hypothetical protein
MVMLSRAWLEFLAAEGREALFQAIVDEVRRQFPEPAAKLQVEGTVFRIVDRRGGPPESRMYALWQDD